MIGGMSRMANKDYKETVKQLREGVNALLERISASQASVTDLLTQVKAAEKSLLEKEEQERRERLERERQERLRSVLASDKDLAVHVGGIDEPEDEPETPATPVAEESAAVSPADGQAATPVAQEDEAALSRTSAEADAGASAEQAGGANVEELRPSERRSGYEAHVIEPSVSTRPASSRAAISSAPRSRAAISSAPRSRAATSSAPHSRAATSSVPRSRAAADAPPRPRRPAAKSGPAGLTRTAARTSAIMTRTKRQRIRKRSKRNPARMPAIGRTMASSATAR